MEKEKELIYQHAKKYKKLFEKIAVNPYIYEVNGNRYRQVIFKNRNGKTTATAIIAPSNNNEDEARKAHDPLTLYGATASGIYLGGKGRAAMSPNILNPLLIALSNVEDPEIQKGVEKFAELRNLHQQFNDRFQEAQTNFDAVTVVTEEDLAYITEKSAQLSVLHDQLTKIMTDDVPFFIEWRKRLKEKGIWGSVPLHSKGFIEQMISSHHKSKAKRAELPAVEGDTYEERVAFTIERLNREERKILDSHIKTLRWPKM
ncbi:hypothetical protein [Jeotgalibacillus aurantiacus]|uniref:hypothetical protein n=1 Tax=Jeotgalibacillus aurantiacus TaxID=2763266 RepID=UPI001D0B17D7|nr:hypothetical protein [Jeotgalibacillus aurantiacus]